MTIKQTQTKIFNFSDMGLNFCAGSKNLLPDRFKKMLSIGYNEQTVSSIAVSGNQVTLTYGVSHGYVADRVLKINSGVLATINNGEFVIDSVTSNTVTMTIDSAPLSIVGGLTTRIAPLGYQLVYELNNIHVYKFKALDESDLFLRLCFQDQASRRNCISPCVGRSYDNSTGFINDDYALTENRSITSPSTGFKWEMSYGATSSHNDWNYAQGLSSYGKGVVVGSLYHFVLMHSISNSSYYGRVNGVLPTVCFDYEKLSLPVIFGENYSNITSVASDYQLSNSAAYIGNIKVFFEDSIDSDRMFPLTSVTKSSYLPATIDAFNTTTATLLEIYEATTKQKLGSALGLYIARYGTSSQPSLSPLDSPSLTYDIDVSNICVIHSSCSNSSTSAACFIVAPIEEVKIGY